MISETPPALSPESVCWPGQLGSSPTLPLAGGDRADGVQGFPPHTGLLKASWSHVNLRRSTNIHFLIHSSGAGEGRQLPQAGDRLDTDSLRALKPQSASPWNPPGPAGVTHSPHPSEFEHWDPTETRSIDGRGTASSALAGHRPFTEAQTS